MNESPNSFDINATRAIRNYTPKEMLARVLWSLCQPLFRLSPRLLYGWRNSLLRIFGASIGTGVRIHQTAHIRYPWLLTVGDDSAIGEHAVVYNLGAVSIGTRTTISQNAHLCAGTHDHHDRSFPLVRSNIGIGDDCWICADSFIGPDVVLGDRTITAARAVVVKSTNADEIVGGNPAKQIGMREPLSSSLSL